MPRVLITLLCLLISACSMRSAIDAMSSPEDRAFAQEMVVKLRSGDQAWLQQQFSPELWEESGKQLAQVPAMYPEMPGETELVGFNISTSNVNGRRERDRQFTLVTHGGGRWTVTTFRTFASGGPDRVVQWSVVPHNSPPPELTTLDTMESVLPWFWGGLIFALLLVGGLIFWLVRRSRRRSAAGPGVR
ncbi:MAG: hypothetical protein ACXWUQ_18195 [Allosphingosinicella sp.]